MPSSGSTTHRTPEVPERSPPSSPRNPSRGPGPEQVVDDHGLGVAVHGRHDVGRRALGVDDQVVRPLVAQEGTGPVGRRATPAGAGRESSAGHRAIGSRHGSWAHPLVLDRPDSVPYVLTTYRRALALPGAWQFSAHGIRRAPADRDDRPGHRPADQHDDRLLRPGRASCRPRSRWQRRPARSSAAGGSTGSGSTGCCPWLGAVNAIALVGFVAAVEYGLPVVVQALVVAVAGAAQPAIGSMVRARWAAAAPDADRLRSAFALESIIDELIFSIGPLITAFLAFQLGLPLPLIVSAVIGLTGAIALSLQRGSEPTPSGDRHSVPRARGTRRRPAAARPAARRDRRDGDRRRVRQLRGLRRRVHPGGRGLGRVRHHPRTVGVRLDARRHRLRLAALGAAARPPGDGAVGAPRPGARARPVRRQRAPAGADHLPRGRRGRARPSSPTSRSRSDWCPGTC